MAVVGARNERNPGSDFVGWFSRKELDEIVELKVGEVVDYIDGCIASEKAG